jgi:hypothetical protein
MASSPTDVSGSIASQPLVTEQDLRILEPGLLLAHPELHHYTRFPALEAIWINQTFRATHYRDLNDTTEITRLRVPLKQAVARRFREFLMGRQKGSFAFRKRLEKVGGLLAVAQGEADRLVDALYAISFEQADAVAIPYITSFCGHPPGSYESTNGLLSQWRGYGHGGGYCLVLDTRDLGEQLGQECDVRYFVHASLGEAVYAVDDLSIENKYGDILDNCDAFLRCVVDETDPDETLQAAFTPWITAVTRFKHQGFREENEVRLVAIPAAPVTVRAVREIHPEAILKPLTQVEHLGGRSFITLFDGVTGGLPVRRIIVGPSAHQEKNALAARTLVEGRVPVILSETPFIE